MGEGGAVWMPRAEGARGEGAREEGPGGGISLGAFELVDAGEWDVIHVIEKPEAC